MILVKDARERTRFLKFAVVGTIGFGVDFGVFNLFRNVFGAAAEVSSVISFLTAVMSNFVWNRYWTYPESRSKPIFGQLMQFTIVNIVGLIIRTAVFVVIVEPMVRLFERIAVPVPLTGRVIGENFALATVVVIVLFWNFFINRYWTYNDIDEAVDFK
ncbi:GtrA family protein [Chloroflexota bacterium]